MKRRHVFKRILHILVILSVLLILDLVLPLQKAVERSTSKYEIVGGKGGYAKYYWIETKHFEFTIDPDIWEDSQPGDTFEVSYSPVFRVVHWAKEVRPAETRLVSIDTKLYISFYILPFVLLAVCIISLYQKDEYNMLTGLIIGAIMFAVIIGFGMPGIWKFF